MSERAGKNEGVLRFEGEEVRVGDIGKPMPPLTPAELEALRSLEEGLGLRPARVRQ